MARMFFYRTFRSVTNQDPTVHAILAAIKNERLKISTVHQISGIAAATVKNWEDGKTIKPQNATLTAVSSAIGYVRHDRLNRDGTVEVAFEKARELDWRNEIEKQADWLLVNGTPKQKSAIMQAKRAKRAAKKKTKTNGGHQ